jgi:hypothetical protein
MIFLELKGPPILLANLPQIHHCGPNHGLFRVSQEFAHVLKDLKFASKYAKRHE